MLELRDFINQMELTDIYKTFYLKKQTIYFTQHLMEFSQKIDSILRQKNQGSVHTRELK